MNVEQGSNNNKASQRDKIQLKIHQSINVDWNSIGRLHHRLTLHEQSLKSRIQWTAISS